MLETIILVVFSMLMVEILTPATLGLVALGVTLTLLKVQTNKLVRNILALGIFSSYWFTYGKIIDPEVGLNFLTSIIVLKILEKETIRDRYMIFFGILLLVCAGSLFERSLTYVFFFAISFFFLIRSFYSFLGQKWRLKDLAKAMIWTLPLTGILFFFIPRLLNPIPFQQRTLNEGEVGYTPDVNISDIDSLMQNETPVFQVLVNKKIGQQDLYWRGNTLSYNDGWNWPLMIQDQDKSTPRLGIDDSVDAVIQNFRLFNRSDYFFALDTPSLIYYGRDFFELGKLKTLQQNRWEWVQKYQAKSVISSVVSEENVGNHYLQVGLSKDEKEKIHQLFPEKEFSTLTLALRNYFSQNGFSYSLAPGKITRLSSFLDKKIGFCSHYASSVALILRTKGIPSRLVSGFMGGDYNRFADFYLISQNDAHVWVEAFYDGKWLRLDPTEWIAPDRILLGGEAFMEKTNSGGNKRGQYNFPPFFRDAQRWFQQWDFHFYQWLDQMDYFSQEALLQKINFKREWLFSLLPLILVLFMLTYSLFLWLQKRHLHESPHDKLWREFYKKMSKRGVKLSSLSLTESEKVLKDSKDEQIMKLWKDLIEVSYRNQGAIKEIKKRIRNL